MSFLERAGPLATLSRQATPGATAIDSRPDEHRASPRRRNLKAGKAILSATTLLDCTVRDISDTGARLEFGAMATLPPEFKLHIVSTDQTIPVELTWQRGTTAGVRFKIVPG
jgi:hypothetical protein